MINFLQFPFISFSLNLIHFIMCAHEIFHFHTRRLLLPRLVVCLRGGDEESHRATSCYCSGNMFCVLLRNSSLPPISAFLLILKLFSRALLRSVSNEYLQYTRTFYFYHPFVECNLLICMYKCII